MLSLKAIRSSLYLLFFVVILYNCSILRADETNIDIKIDTLFIDEVFSKNCKVIEFALPDGLVVLENGTIIITDQENNQLVQLSEDGSLKKIYGQLGSGKWGFYRPRDIALGKDKIFITDQGNKRVVMLSFDLEWLGEIPVEIYPDIIVPKTDGSILVGSRSQSIGSYLFINYDINGNKIETIGESFSNDDDNQITQTALNVLTATCLSTGELAYCFKGLAYCICGNENTQGWMIEQDIEETRDWFYQGKFPDRTLPSIAKNNKLEDFVYDIREKCKLDNASSVPLFVDDLVEYDGSLFALVSSTIHEYTCSGQLKRRFIILDSNLEQVVFDRINIDKNGTFFLLSKYLTSTCWKVDSSILTINK